MIGRGASRCVRLGPIAATCSHRFGRIASSPSTGLTCHLEQIVRPVPLQRRHHCTQTRLTSSIRRRLSGASTPLRQLAPHSSAVSGAQKEESRKCARPLDLGGCATPHVEFLPQADQNPRRRCQQTGVRAPLAVVDSDTLMHPSEWLSGSHWQSHRHENRIHRTHQCLLEHKDDQADQTC